MITQNLMPNWVNIDKYTQTTYNLSYRIRKLTDKDSVNTRLIQTRTQNIGKIHKNDSIYTNRNTNCQEHQ